MHVCILILTELRLTARANKPLFIPWTRFFTLQRYAFFFWYKTKILEFLQALIGPKYLWRNSCCWTCGGRRGWPKQEFFFSFSNAWEDFLQCNYLCKFLFFMIQVAHLKEKIDRMLNGEHASLILFLQSISYLRLWEIGVQYFFFLRRYSLSFMNFWGVLLDFSL